MPNFNANVMGTDGNVPIYQPEARWCWWSLSEIYTGDVALQKYVPKVKDYVMDTDTFTTYVVIDVHPETLIPRLKEIRPSYVPWTFSSDDLLFGVGAGQAPDTFRIYYDKTVYPYVLSVDLRARVPGDRVRYCKLFVGSDLGNTGTVISEIYDASNNFVTDRVGLTLVNDFRVVDICYTTKELNDNTIVTAVYYDDEGFVAYKRQFLIEETSFIRFTNAETKYITHISLDTAFNSMDDNHLIEYPVNVPLNALNAFGVIHYSDGQEIRLPVDGTRFKMIGMDSVVATIVNQKHEIGLLYTLGANEFTYSTVTHDNATISESYILKMVNPNNAYSIKLYAYPEWAGEGFGWRLRWFMYNLDRNISVDVTPHVVISTSTLYDAKAYGYTQQLAVTLDLRHVSLAYRPYLHTQVINVELIRPFTERTTCWRVMNERGIGQVMYGQDVFAARTGINILSIVSGYTTLEEWLENIYFKTYPLRFSQYEVIPPQPNRIEVIYNGEVVSVDISDWNKPFNFSTTVQSGSTVYVKFKRFGSPEYIELSIAALTVFS